jgi:hypothetical protein
MVAGKRSVIWYLWDGWFAGVSPIAYSVPGLPAALARGVSIHAEARKEHEADIAEIGTILKSTERKLNALAEAHERGEYMLNALIDTVDRIVRGGKA